MILADPTGEAVTWQLQSQKTLIGTSGDPYFTVGSNKYRFILAGSTYDCGDYTDWYYCDDTSSTPIQDALNYMEINNLTPTDRKLYIEPGIYEEEIWVDGSVAGVKGLTGIVGIGGYPGGSPDRWLPVYLQFSSRIFSE